MSYIPNIRKRYEDETNKNPYWQGYLPEACATYLRGYDCAMEEAVTTFFANLDSHTEPLYESGFRINKLDDEALLSNKRYDEYSNEELNTMSDETCLMIALRTALFDFLEARRNEYGVAVLDSLSGDEEQEDHERKTDCGEIEHAYFESDENVLYSSGSCNLTKNRKKHEFDERETLPNGTIRIWLSADQFFEVSKKMPEEQIQWILKTCKDVEKAEDE